MKLDLAPTTRMAIRAAVVATAAVIVSRISFLERPYWIVLTSVLLIYETAGESIKRSGQRLAMTLAGCLTGWLIYLIAEPIPALRWSLLLSGVFLTVYFRSNPRGVVYAPMIFFASVYVVFVFAVVGGWTGRLFLTRVYDTGIGCALALAGSLLVLPLRAGHQVADDLEEFWKSCSDYFEKIMKSLEMPMSGPTPGDRKALLKQLELLRMRNRNSAYESFLDRRTRQQQSQLVDASERMSRHLLALGAVIQSELPASSLAELRAQAAILLGRTENGFRRIICSPRDCSPSDHPNPPSAAELARAAMQATIDKRTEQIDVVRILPAIYHLGEVCVQLETMS